jgi:hypothetical protein
MMDIEVQRKRAEASPAFNSGRRDLFMGRLKKPGAAREQSCRNKACKGFKLPEEV